MSNWSGFQTRLRGRRGEQRAKIVWEKISTLVYLGNLLRKMRLTKNSRKNTCDMMISGPNGFRSPILDCPQAAVGHKVHIRIAWDFTLMFMEIRLA